MRGYSVFLYGRIAVVTNVCQEIMDFTPSQFFTVIRKVIQNNQSILTQTDSSDYYQCHTKLHSAAQQKHSSSKQDAQSEFSILCLKLMTSSVTWSNGFELEWLRILSSFSRPTVFFPLPVPIFLFISEKVLILWLDKKKESKVFLLFAILSL